MILLFMILHLRAMECHLSCVITHDKCDMITLLFLLMAKNIILRLNCLVFALIVDVSFCPFYLRSNLIAVCAMA